MKTKTSIKDKISKKDIEEYYKITQKALCIVLIEVVAGREEDAKEIILMVESYLSDSEYFEKRGDYVNAFGAIYYAHGWIDCGVRLGIFDVKDDKLFTIK